MRGRRKRGKGKLIGALALVALAAALVAGIARLPGPQEEQSSELVPVGTFAGRKNIYDRRLRELAVTLQVTSVYARPLELREPEVIAGALAAILETDERELLSALSSEMSFVWLGRQLEPEKGARIAALKAKGIYLVDEEQRFYPQGESAAHVLGFLSNEQGLAGIEFYYEQLLRGGWGLEQRMPLKLPPSVDTGKGVHLVLTLDLAIQSHLERELARLQKTTGAAAATALVMDPASGEILAMVSLPAFDPNTFWRHDTAALRNRVLADPLSPGGLWNIFRLAAAIDAGREIPAGSTGRSSPGGSPAGRREEKNPGPPHGDWIELPPGGYVSPALAALGDGGPAADDLQQFLGKLGLFGEIEVDLPKAPGNGQASEKEAAAGGQEMHPTVTALQLLAAFNHLLSGSGTGPPHLLQGLMPPGQQPLPLTPQQQPPQVGVAVNQTVLALLRDEGDAGLAAGTIESLSAPREATAAGAAGGDECRQQDVLLGLSAGPSPLSFLMVLDDACIDIHRPSALRSSGERFVRQAGSLRQGEATRPVAADKKPDGEIHRQWRRLHHLNEKVAVKPAVREELMPDVRGYGLRQALRATQAFGIQVQVTGSGRVAGQQPRAGSPLTGIREIRLELRSGHD